MTIRRMRTFDVSMSEKSIPDLDQEVDRLSGRLPNPLGSWLRALHRGSAWRRVPAGSALVVGGVFSFLPVLGIWMLPLGIVLLAKDVAPLRRPAARMLAWAQRGKPDRTTRPPSG